MKLKKKKIFSVFIWRYGDDAELHTNISSAKRKKYAEEKSTGGDNITKF